MIPKYRAWNKATKEMYQADDVVDIDIERKEILVKKPSFKRLSYKFMSGIELMASTGFRDINGKDIFEDDIVMSRCGLFKGVVILNQDLGAYVIRLIGYKDCVRLKTVAKTVEVIGNFYENQELWKEKQWRKNSERMIAARYAECTDQKK